MRVYIITDFEGITGVALWEQVVPTLDANRYAAAQRLLMSDINAAVQGCLDGGATRVVVLDGHGVPMNFVPELMHPGAEYLCGRGFPTGWGLDDGFDVGMQIGAHSMCRTPDGILNHTQSHANDARYWYHGRETGELGQGGLVFGHYDIPNVFVSGDAAACREATAFFGEHCVTVPVKYGYSRHCGRFLAPEKTRELIREGAAEAVRRGRLVPPLKLALPIVARVETLPAPVPDEMPLAEVYAAPHVSHEGTCPTQLDIYRF